ncbi:Hypothetical predicted protein, partial [Pelobates cultripes]
PAPPPHHNANAYKKSLTRHLLNAAKLLIMASWRCTKEPTLQQWMDKIEKIRKMEMLTASVKGSTERYLQMWTPWIDYMTR